MRVFLLFIFVSSVAISLNAQNGIYTCGRQAYKAVNSVNNTEGHDKCRITIRIYGVGGNDFVLVETQPDSTKKIISCKWKIISELQMSPNATGKKIFKSYNAILQSDNKTYQISIIKNVKSGKITIAAINNDGATNWFYDLKKVN